MRTFVNLILSRDVPSMSSETGVRNMSPVNSQLVFLASMPAVPSNTCRRQSGGGNSSSGVLLEVPTLCQTDVNTCTTALEPVTSSTWPLLLVPSGSVRWTISAYLGNCRCEGRPRELPTSTIHVSENIAQFTIYLRETT